MIYGINATIYKFKNWVIQESKKNISLDIIIQTYEQKTEVSIKNEFNINLEMSTVTSNQYLKLGKSINNFITVYLFLQLTVYYLQNISKNSEFNRFLCSLNYN
jgi:hypothetical protein